LSRSAASAAPKPARPTARQRPGGAIVSRVHADAARERWERQHVHAALACACIDELLARHDRFAQAREDRIAARTAGATAARTDNSPAACDPSTPIAGQLVTSS